MIVMGTAAKRNQGVTTALRITADSEYRIQRNRFSM
jgi:hypothetical protein